MTEDDTLLGSESTTRKTYIGLWMLGGITLGTATALGQPLIGFLAFLTSVIAAIGVWYSYPGPMFDERDTQIHDKASGHTLTIVGYASAVIFPSLTALYGLDYFEWGPMTSAVALTIAGIYLLYGAISFALED